MNLTYQASKQAKSIDDKDLGDVREVESNYILTLNESIFYIPAYLIEKYEGDNLWFRIDEDEAKSKFKIATEPFRS